MGKGAVAVEKMKKKKGRPSLLDLQKRSLKQQQQQQQQLQLRSNNNNNNNKTPKKPTQNPTRRSTRRNPNPNSDDESDENPSSTPKHNNKLKRVLKSPEDDSGEANSGSDEAGSSGSGSNPRKRKIDSIAPGSAPEKVEKHSAATNQASPQQGSKLDNGPSTPLPDKKLLLFILDRIQKKDTYGVFSDPVDPEELPDYFEVITDPMDFSTVRKKLGDGAYASLEQFEKDIYLICSNAMQYNSSDTVYFRQARAIQELAKKNFDNLRQDSDDNETEGGPGPEPEPEPEPKVVRRGRPPKNSKRPPGRPPLERTKSPLERANSGPSQATLATPGGNTNRSNNSDVRKVSPLLDKYGSPDLFARSSYGLRFGEAYIGWSAERNERTDDMTGSASKGIMFKHGKKNIMLDDNRRNTYIHSCTLASGQESSVLTTFDGERKHLIPVGLQSEYGYARSVARFTAKLGPVAWKVASRKIQRCLPAGVKFGPGWVGENEAPTERAVAQHLPAGAGTGQPSPPASLPECEGPSSALVEGRVDSNHSAQKKVEQLSPIQPNLDEGSSNALSPSAGKGGTSPASCSPVIPCNKNGGASKLNPSSFHPNTTSSMLLSRSAGSIKAGQQPAQIHQGANNKPRINGLNNGSSGLHFASQMGKLIGNGAAKPTVNSLGPSAANNNGSSKEVKVAGNSSPVKSSDGLPNVGLPQKGSSGPPDLNVGFHSPGSPCSARADSVQPDLALQL